MQLWKDIPNFEGLYQANINGEIRSLDHIRKNGTNKYIQKGKILKFNKNNSGYLQVRLSKNGISKTYRVNRLIALTFIENPLNKETVNHIDGKIYNSLLEAKQDLKNKNAHITEVCQGKLKNTCGYSFRYLESEEMTYRTLGA